MGLWFCCSLTFYTVWVIYLRHIYETGHMPLSAKQHALPFLWIVIAMAFNIIYQTLIHSNFPAKIFLMQKTICLHPQTNLPTRQKLPIFATLPRINWVFISRSCLLFKCSIKTTHWRALSYLLYLFLITITSKKLFFETGKYGGGRLVSGCK